MDKAPKGVRIHIGLLGRMNVGKSTFLNMITGQDVSITSAVPGTTTDVVEKAMELLPVGPVVFHDTAGLDDVSDLSAKRIQKTERVYNKADVLVLIVEPEQWGPFEEKVVAFAHKEKMPLMIVVNKIDVRVPTEDYVEQLYRHTQYVVAISSIDRHQRDHYVSEIKAGLQKALQEHYFHAPALIGDLIPSGGMGILVIPIDLQAPKGRLILPQVQTIRDALDNDASMIMVKEREYAHLLKKIKDKPDIVVCDSQVVLKMVADTPADVKCTTFSILFGRFKGDLITLSQGAAAIEHLRSGDRVLISEACSHHAIEDDIGRVKIPRWLKQYTGCNLEVDVFSGHDYPDNLEQYALVIMCGSCMLNRKETISRIHRARAAGVPITNYGICISVTQGVVKRVLSPFPAALETYEQAIKVRRVSCQ
jgi:[FeFe] hydrogenase H-cluster maturation GTPase HydF